MAPSAASPIGIIVSDRGWITATQTDCLKDFRSRAHVCGARTDARTTPAVDVEAAVPQSRYRGAGGVDPLFDTFETTLAGRSSSVAAAVAQREMNVPLRSSRNACCSSSLGVHHDRTVPGHRLLDRLSRDEQEADPLVARLHHDLVAAIEQHQRSIARCRSAARASSRRRPARSARRCGADASRNVPEPAKTYANAWFVRSTASRLRRPGGTDTSR